MYEVQIEVVKAEVGEGSKTSEVTSKVSRKKEVFIIRNYRGFGFSQSANSHLLQAASTCSGLWKVFQSFEVTNTSDLSTPALAMPCDEHSGLHER